MRKMLPLLLLIQLFMSSPLHALSYPPPVEEPTYLKETEILTVGARVYMFHSGTRDVRNAIKIGDVLVVYRDYPPDVSNEAKHTGKVKVLSTIGDYYFEGYVVEGSVQPGSLALKGTTACIITTRLKEK